MVFFKLNFLNKRLTSKTIGDRNMALDHLAFMLLHTNILHTAQNILFHIIIKH